MCMCMCVRCNFVSCELLSVCFIIQDMHAWWLYQTSKEYTNTLVHIMASGVAVCDMQCLPVLLIHPHKVRLENMIQ